MGSNFNFNASVVSPSAFPLAATLRRSFSLSRTPVMAKATSKAKAAASAILHGQNPKDGVAAVSSSKKFGTTDNGSSKSKPSMSIPKEGFAPSSSIKTPKTPADEGIEFFESAAVHGGAPIQVYELRLDPDGGPSKELSVSD